MLWNGQGLQPDGKGIHLHMTNFIYFSALFILRLMARILLVITVSIAMLGFCLCYLPFTALAWLDNAETERLAKNDRS